MEISNSQELQLQENASSYKDHLDINNNYQTSSVNTNIISMQVPMTSQDNNNENKKPITIKSSNDFSDYLNEINTKASASSVFFNINHPKFNNTVEYDMYNSYNLLEEINKLSRQMNLMKKINNQKYVKYMEEFKAIDQQIEDFTNSISHNFQPFINKLTVHTNNL